ncbi:hypothetical protein OG563_28720 [Nocardia vinacea]|uniref:NAD(P)-binding domain-containing protein n=1 Tax=Nocardia vinacea TaxID=96468 RepID=A0ABZ1YN73_9NOCA|nr:hypothetical protein [Nocardia vinacea]
MFVENAAALAGLGQQVLCSSRSGVAAHSLAREMQRPADRGDAHALREQGMDLVVALPGGLGAQSRCRGLVLRWRLFGFGLLFLGLFVV